MVRRAAGPGSCRSMLSGNTKSSSAQPGSPTPAPGSMIPEPWSLKRWYRHFYHVLQKEGITRGRLGVTVHGLRHAYLQKMYEDITGVPAPIKLPDHRPDPELHQRAMQQLVEAAGHSLAAKA